MLVKRNSMTHRLGRLDELPRVTLGHTPTPIEHLVNLTAQEQSAQIYVKRDDCTGLAFGGNKVRQLEFYLGEAQRQEADTVLITGAVQSNFVRLAAAAACKLGMDCHIQLEERVPKDDENYRNSGNVLLDKMLGATLYSYADGDDEAGADRQLGLIAEDLRKKGRKPYIVPLSPGHPPLGALGYVDAAREILSQCDDSGLAFDEIVVASGSGNTHAGLLFGLRAGGSNIPVTGTCVRRTATSQLDRIRDRCREIAVLLQIEPVVTESDIILTDDYFAPGYGQLNSAAIEAIRRAAQTEALLLDPVYTAKTMACALARASALVPEKSILMVHTGGTPALFAYATDLAGLFSEVSPEI